MTKHKFGHFVITKSLKQS